MEYLWILKHGTWDLEIRFFHPQKNPVLFTNLFRDVLLSLVQDGGFQLHVARLVDPVHVAEGRGDGEETVLHFAQGVVHLENLLFGMGILLYTF